MNELAHLPLIYLATPYTKYEPNIDTAFRDASALAARLLLKGLRIYSPIAHCHPLAVYGSIDPKNHSIWLPYQEAMMAKADALLVAQMQGWRESYGVTHEIDFFLRLRKPVFYLDTVLLKVAQHPFGFDAPETGGEEHAAAVQKLGATA